MRKRYVQRFIHGQWTLVEGSTTPRTEAPYVIPDIQPYRSAITGEIIGSRSIHRAHLKQYGCIEVGNERLPPRKPVPMGSPVEDIRQAYREYRRKRGH